MPQLHGVDLTLAIGRKEEARRLRAAQRRILQLRLATAGLLDEGDKGPPICVVMEGWDASGKGGAIRRLVASLDIRHYRIAFFAKPTAVEKGHQFLWRFQPSLPAWGEMAIFDRSWYGRVLVERVEGFATASEWGRAYDEIVELERGLALDGTIMIKFWLEISHEEQLRRFRSRQDDPLRAWKLSEEDWRNREKRPEYESALQDMFAKTDHDLGPWEIVEAEDKRYARVKVIETVVARVEEGLARMGRSVPAPLGSASGGPEAVDGPGDEVEAVEAG